MKLDPTLTLILGWLLNEISQWFRSRKEDKKYSKKALFTLLEIHHILYNMKIENIDLFVERVLIRFPRELQTEEVRLEITKMLTELIKWIRFQEAQESFNKIEDVYNKSVEELSKVDPINAYYLYGQNELPKFLEVFDKVHEKIEQDNPNEIFELENSELDLSSLMKSMSNELSPTAIENATNEIRDLILSVARGINYIYWFKARHIMRQLAKEDKAILRRILTNC